MPNQTKKVTRVDTDYNPKHSSQSTRHRQTVDKVQVQPKPVNTNLSKHAKVVNVYRSRSTTKKTASRRRTSQERRLVKDAVAVAPPRPTGDTILPALRLGAGVVDLTDPVEPSQEGEIVQEEGRQEPKHKRRKLSEKSVEDQPAGHGSDLRPCSDNPVRAEDGKPEDLDEEDAIDPCMEPEYQAECYQYMRELEVSGNYF